MGKVADPKFRGMVCLWWGSGTQQGAKSWGAQLFLAPEKLGTPTFGGLHWPYRLHLTLCKRWVYPQTFEQAAAILGVGSAKKMQQGGKKLGCATLLIQICYLGSQLHHVPNSPPHLRLQRLQYEGAAGAERTVSVALANGHDSKGERGAGRLL